MLLSDTQIRKYQQLYRNKFGTEIPFEDARVQASRLVRLYEIILQKPIRDVQPADITKTTMT